MKFREDVTMNGLLLLESSIFCIYLRMTTGYTMRGYRTGNVIFCFKQRNMKQAAVTIKELQPQNSYCYNPHDKSNVNQLTELKGLAFLGSRCTSCIFALVVMTQQ